jgi:lipopolysaccharide transport system ATP-binding protein
VTFDVKKGEIVGIIGRNGSGKTTLLRILSRITEPTEGYAEIKGRVGSLLEVGTGFHPELTGRENIYLNGAILGMKRAEIDGKFDEIVAFSEIEKFLDTPVKRYSSGMYVRLAFSVAAHLEPEILLVDEVLAVGDAAFQKKCLGKMGDVASEGRTVLFVSHNMAAVRNICPRAIWLEGGSVFQSGDTLAVTEAYLRKSLRADSLADVAALINSLPPDSAFRLEAVEVRQNSRPGNVVVNGQPVEIEIRYSVLKRTTGMRVYFDLLDDERNILIRTFHDDDAEAIGTMEPGHYLSTATIPPGLLAPRAYEVRVHGGIFNVRSCVGEGIGIPLTVQATSGVNRGYPQDTIRSKLQPKIPWRTKRRA